MKVCGHGGGDKAGHRLLANGVNHAGQVAAFRDQFGARAGVQLVLDFVQQVFELFGFLQKTILNLVAFLKVYAFWNPATIFHD